MTTSKPLLVGHRGAAASEPENTLRSFAAAIKAGANAIEFDTRLTKDKKLVVFHDATLNRTTNGKGNIHEFTYRELQRLDAGKGEKIPTAEEALNFIVRKNKAIALLEIKDKDSVPQVAEVVKKLKMPDKQLKRQSLQHQLIIHSFSAAAVKEIKILLPEIPTALIISNRIHNLPGFFRLCKMLKVEWIFSRGDITTKAFLNAAHHQHFKVEVWVANTKAEMEKFWKMGVEGIASDRPELFKQISKNLINKQLF